jgi:hypothetical protein
MGNRDRIPSPFGGQRGEYAGERRSASFVPCGSERNAQWEARSAGLAVANRLTFTVADSDAGAVGVGQPPIGVEAADRVGMTKLGEQFASAAELPSRRRPTCLPLNRHLRIRGVHDSRQRPQVE